MRLGSMQRFTDGRWEFYNPVHIVFGVDTLRLVGEFVDGSHVLFLTTSGFAKRGLTDEVAGMLGSSLVEIVDNIEPNPELAQLERLVEDLRHMDFDTIVALGGGSVIDTAKVISAVLPRIGKGFSLRAHLERNAGELTETGIPVVAIPTTAGTGAEVTPFATVWDLGAKKKYSLSGQGLFPKVALIDPSLTLTLPREQTLISGLDAVSHAFESIWNRNATPISIMYATEALRIAMPTLPLVVEDLGNLEHRTKMLQASLFAGLAISNTRTALAHSISYSLTLNYGVPHGLACSFALPAILRFNAEEDDGRLSGLARSLEFSSVQDLFQYVSLFLDRLTAQRMLSEYVDSDLEELKGKTLEMVSSDRLDNNLRKAHREDLLGIITVSLF